jgi:hypothetical protein
VRLGVGAYVGDAILVEIALDLIESADMRDVAAARPL